MMSGVCWTKFVLFFHVICWTATVTLIAYWLYRFKLNEDLSIVEYKKYYESKTDVFPVVSLCLRNPFSKKNFRMTSPGINETSYVNFLEGKYFVPEMLTIDYENITLDMSKYVVEYYVEWRNGSHGNYSPTNDDGKIFTSSYAGFWLNWLYNCYALKVPPDKQIQIFSVLVKSNIFPSSNRPQHYDMMVLLHYPNQLLRSLKTIKYAWPKRETNDNYVMRFKINGVEIMRRRNKNSRPCYKNWENHDDNVIGKHTNTVGCRAPYQDPSDNIAPCSTKDQMKKARFTLRSDEYGILPPCKGMEKIYYTYEESELSGTDWSGTGHFWFGIYLFDQQFKEIVQTR